MSETITVIIKYCLSSNNTEVKEIELASLDISLLSVCESLGTESGIFTFDRYYGKSAVMFEYQMLPYILVNNDYYEWNVPYGQAKIGDFIRTHGIDSWNPLYVEVNNAGGSGLFRSLYQSWAAIEPVLDEIGRCILLKDLILFVFNSFSSNKKKKPSHEEFYKFIVSKSQWDLRELSHMLLCDEALLKNLLLAYGYEEHEGKYWKNEYKVQKYINAVESVRDRDLYNNHGTIVNCFSLNDVIRLINNDLAYLYVLNDMKKSDDEIRIINEKIYRTVEKSDEYYTYDSIEHIIKPLEPFNSDFTEETEKYLYNLYFDLGQCIDSIIQLLENDIMI